MRMTAVATAFRAHSESAQWFFSKHHRHWELQSTLVVHTAFKTVSNALELAMIASSAALMQACKREASPAKTVDLSEMFGRDSKKAACVSSAKIFCSVQFFDRDQVYHRNVQQKFWTGSLCQLC